jgi:hypothetical protein
MGDRVLRLLAVFGALAALGVSAGDAIAQDRFAPLDQPGPALTPTPAQLSAALNCEPSVRDARVEPVLLSPGTGTMASENFGWNWEPALEKLGISWCAYTPPNETLGRIDISGEYLVYAIRKTYKLAGRQIAIIGHSQGGMSMRWALRFRTGNDGRASITLAFGKAGRRHVIATATEYNAGTAIVVVRRPRHRRRVMIAAG